MNGIKILMWGWHCHSQSVPVILTSMFILFHRRWWWHWMSSPSSGADVEHCTRCDDIKLPGPWRGFPTILSSCWRPLSSMYLALATLISILRPHGFHYWVMRVSGTLQHAGIPHFFAPTCHGLKQDNQQKYSKICQSCHRFPEVGQARGFSCCSSCNLVRADFAVPWCGLGIHPTPWLKAGLLEAGCSRTWQTVFCWGQTGW